MSEIILIPVEDWGGDAVHFLYRLLSERPPEANISHKTMPSFSRHARFVRHHPYSDWWLIVMKAFMANSDGKETFFQDPVGACYVSRENEIGIQIAHEHQRKGYARIALGIILASRRGDRLLANIAPGNEPSRRLFESTGFKLIQHTFELELKP